MAELIPWLARFKSGEIDLILGSASAPRRAVLGQLGVPFNVVVSSFPEDLEKATFSDDFTQYPLATSRGKTEAIMKQLGSFRKPTVLVTCDTVVLKDLKHIIEKPDDAIHARDMLRGLRGSEHHVATGVVITLSTGHRIIRSEFVSISHVKFCDLSDKIIDAYIATGEPYNKAGGYGIQSLGELLVETITGSHTNVIGLPLRETSRSIASLLQDNYDCK